MDWSAETLVFDGCCYGRGWVEGVVFEVDVAGLAILKVVEVDGELAVAVLVFDGQERLLVGGLAGGFFKA